jgi:peptide/nickel transport system substrate-binding protein
VADGRVIVRPRLAATMPSTSNGQWKINADGTMEMTWKLRPDAKWHDGTAFTSEDLAFTVRIGQDAELPLLSSRVFRFIESVATPDPQTITVSWNRPYILADTMFTNEVGLPLPKHLLENAYTSNKATFVEQPYFTAEFVGAGPFKVREFARASHVVLEAFDGYVLGRPNIDEIEVKFFNDPTVIVANVQSGVVDLTMGRGLAPEQAVQAAEQWQNGKVDVSFASWIALYPQFIDPDPAVLANVEFRRALMHGLNREQMVEALTLGKSRPVTSYIGPSSPEFEDVQSAVMKYDFDPRKAAQTIEGLGYGRGPDGQYRDAAGQPLTIEIRTTAGDQLREDSMLTSADMWRQLGVSAQPVIIPRQRASDREYRVTRPAFDITRQPNELTESALQRFQANEIPTPDNDWGGNNRARYSNPEYDSLVNRFLVTFDKREQVELAKLINRHISEHLPAMGLFYSIEPTLIHNRLINVTAANDVRNAHEWDVR